MYIRKLVLFTIGTIVLFTIKGLYILDNKNISLKEFSKNIEQKFLHFDGPAKYAKIHHYIRTRDDESLPEYKMGYLHDEFIKAAKSLKFRNSDKLDWIERGPTNAGGRARGLIVDPDDTTHHTFFAGTGGGGIWKTENGGGNWENLTPDLPNLATTSLAMSINNTNVIYVGTGEGFSSLLVNGSGMWKSIDKGKTWFALTSTTNNNKFQNVLRIVVNPADENELVVCTTSSPRDRAVNQYESFILKSKDGGLPWEEQHKAP